MAFAVGNQRIDQWREIWKICFSISGVFYVLLNIKIEVCCLISSHGLSSLDDQSECIYWKNWKRDLTDRYKLIIVPTLKKGRLNENKQHCCTRGTEKKNKHCFSCGIQIFKDRMEIVNEAEVIGRSIELRLFCLKKKIAKWSELSFWTNRRKKEKGFKGIKNH